MKKLFFILLLIAIGMQFVNAQPTIQWEKSLGGSNAEWAYDIQQTIDGGYVVCGVSGSSDGDVSVNKGNGDFWVVKLDANGTIEWQKTYGGSADEWAYSISQTINGGYIVSGFSNSNDGDATINKGLSDCWIIKLDSLGNLEWQKSFGGSAGENANSIKQTIDGGYIFAGFSGSLNGDITGHHGGVTFSDFWVVKIDVSGVIEWEKSYGGTSYEYASDIQLNQDGGYMVVGKARSTDGDVTNNNGGEDYWLIKIDSLGNLLWQKNYGGSGNDIPNSVQPTMDGGYILAGTSNSTDGDITGVNNGGIDGWIVKTDSIGGIVWEKLYGGTLNDNVNSAQQTANGDYVFSGSSSTGNGDVWVVDIDTIGIVKWQQTYGGSSFDYAYSISQTTDNGFIVCGGSTSLDGDVTGNHGLDDFWVVKLNPYTGMDELITEQEINVYPNPTNGIFTINTQLNEGYIEVYDLVSKKVITEKIKGKNTIINLQSTKKGIYLIKVISGNTVVTQKIVYQ